MDNWYLCHGEQDADLLSVVDVTQLRELRDFRCWAKEENEKCDADVHLIRRGQVMEKAIEVDAGQRVWWKFVLVPGSFLLPPPEIQFGVVGIWDIPQEAPKPQEGSTRAAPQARKNYVREVEQPSMVVEDGGALDLVREVDCTDDSEYTGLQEEQLLDFDIWKMLDGESTGEVVAPKPGLVILRWSNEFNMLRAKRIQYECGVKEKEEAESQAPM